MRSWRARYRERASGLVWSGSMRSVRATEPGRSAPPEQRDRLRSVEEQVGEVLGRVPRRADGAEPKATQIELVAVVEPAVRELQAASPRSDDRGTVRSKLAASRNEVSMEVRLDGVGERQPLRLGDLAMGSDITRRVDDERPTFANRNEI